MNVKSRRFKRQLKLRNVKPSLSLLVISVLLLLGLPYLSIRVMQKFRSQTLSPEPKFEVAYQALLTLSQKTSGYTNPLIGFNSYGISQLNYDTWRQLNGKPVEDLANISEKEIKAIYQTSWQDGGCNQYELPLDIACLDSSVNFGVQQSKQFLTNLPSDPEEAALEVASRRELFRQRQMRPPLTPGKQIALREGLKRDRALADLVAAADDLPQAIASTPAPDAEDSAQGLSANQIYTQVKPSTVEVWNTTQRGIATTASGIILTPDGLILTNHHVIEANPLPSVTLADGRRFTGTVTSIDRTLDLALIQLDNASGLPTAPLADDTSQVSVGDTVYAIGAPRGESWKMSTSEVIELNSTCANGTSPLRCIRTPQGFLYPGNSGGPLINSSGQVIGINRAVQQTTGEGVSIPVETIENFLNNRMGQPQQMNPSNSRREQPNRREQPRQFIPPWDLPRRWL